MRNVGTIDRWIRIIVGIIILSLFFFIDGGLRWIALIGLIPLATGIIRYCPLYLPFGLNTIHKH